MNSSLPLVSIIIPAYNAESYILSAVTSVLNQTYKHLEVIVIDDGSKDSTLDVLKQIADERLRYHTVTNSGQCAASNYGLSKSKGEFIKFFDADDLMNECHIEALLKLALHNPESLILCKWARFYDGIEDATFVGRPEWRDSSAMDYFVTALNSGPDMLPVWQWLIPRKIIEQTGGWDENLSLGNDFEFSSRMLSIVKDIKYCDDAWVYYRSGLTTNMSADVSKKTYMSVLKAIHKSKAILLRNNSDMKIRESYATKYYTWLITYYPYLERKLVTEVEEMIRSLGKVNYTYRWGWKFELISKLLGWKVSRKLQFFYYKIRYC